MSQHPSIHNTHQNEWGCSISSIDVILPYYRGMEFIQIFIKEVAEGEQSLDVAAGKAYSKSLRRFHNWIIRGVFNVNTMQIG